MRLPRYNMLQLLLASTLVALLLGLFTSAWRSLPFDLMQICLSPGGKYLASVSETGAVQVWQLDQGRPRLVARALGSCTYFLDDNRLLVLESDRQKSRVVVRELEIATRRVSEVMQINHPFVLPGHAAAAGNRLYVAGGITQTVQCYDLAQAQLDRELNVGTTPIRSLTLSADGRRLVVTEQGRVHVIDALTGRTISQIDGWSMKMEAITLSADGSQLTAPSDRQSVMFYDSQSGSKTDEWPIRTEGVAQWLATSRDGRLLAVAYREGTENEYYARGRHTIELFDMQAKKTIHEFAHNVGTTFGRFSQPILQLAPDGEVVMASNGNRIQLYEASSGNLRYVIGWNSRLLAAAFFTTGFAIWAAVWGVIAKRESRKNRVAQTGQMPVARADLPPQTDVAPPFALQLCWGLMVTGGIVALAIPISLQFIVMPCFFPTLLFSLYVGIAAVARGAGRDTLGLQRTAALQAINIVACDPANIVLAAMEFALLRTARVREFLQAVNKP